MERFLARRSPATRATHLQGLSAFARWLGAPSPASGLAWLLSAGVLEGNVRVSAWLDALAAAGRSPATIAARLSALRSAVQVGRMLGLVDWALEVPPPRLTPLRDTRGPGRAGVNALLGAAMGQRSREKAARDLAILRLLYDLALRRGEVAGIRLQDLDLKARVVKIQGKGQTEPVLLTLPPGTAAAVQAWLSWRGTAPGPLFHRLDPGGDNLDELHPITGRAVWDVVHGLGLACGLVARPHGLRHSAITDALDAGFDVREVRFFSRHRKLDHVVIYDDNRKDLGGAIAARLSVEVGHVH